VLLDVRHAVLLDVRHAVLMKRQVLMACVHVLLLRLADIGQGSGFRVKGLGCRM
jgi:hypothetical protein